MVQINKLFLRTLTLSLPLGIATPVVFPLESSLEKRGGPVCTDVIIPVSISARNQYIFREVSLNSLFSIASSVVNSLFSNFPIQGTYTIAGTYCEPEVQIANRTNTIQFLAHPATYDRNYWFGGNHPGIDGTRYSWVAYASKQGYPTFSFDRLGNGLSQHPDGLLEVQCAAQAATVNELIKKARIGSHPFPRHFNKVIMVGASMGSLVTNVLMTNYPNAVDASILTGFSKSWINVIPGFTLTAGLLPAAFVDSKRFGSLDPTYLAATSATGVQYLLFYGTSPGQEYFDPALIQANFNARGTITVGEAVSGAVPTTADRYVGSVYVITGEQDVVFCGKLGLPTDAPSDCLSPFNQLAATSALFPRASNYAWYAVPNSGHCWEHQYSAQEGFEKAHQWLAERGF